MNSKKIEDILQHKRQKAIKNVPVIPAILIYSGATKIWMDGDGISHKLRLWHPLSWIFLLIFGFLLLIMEGVKGFKNELDGMGLVLSDYWKKNKDKRSFISIREFYRVRHEKSS